MANRISSYFTDVRREFAQVTWPTRQMAVRLAMFVIVLSLVLAAFLGGLDILFTYLLKKLVLPF
jgi:preprotein translocase subunit SecE